MVLRPGRSYQLKDGDSITFGQVTAIYSIVNLLSNIVIPETPAPRKAQRSQLVIPSTPDSSLNASSDADLSRVADAGRENEELRLLSPPRQGFNKIHSTSGALTVEKDFVTDNDIVDTVNVNSDLISSPVTIASSVSEEKKNLSIFEMDTQKYFTTDRNTRTTDIHEEETQKFVSNEDVDKERASTSMTDKEFLNSEMETNKVVPMIDDDNLTSSRIETINSEMSGREYFNESLSPSPTNLYIDVDENDEDRNSELDVCVNLLGSQNLLDECAVDVANAAKTVEARKLQIVDQALERNGTTPESSSTFNRNIFDAPTQRISETNSRPQRLSSVRLESSALNDDSETDEEGIFEELATKKIERRSFKTDYDTNCRSNSVLFDALTQPINEERDAREMKDENSSNTEEKRNSTRSTNDDDDGDIGMSMAPTQIVYGNLAVSGRNRSETIAETKESDSTDATLVSGIVSTQVLNRDVNSVSAIEAIELAPTQLLEDRESKDKSKGTTVLNQLVDMKDMDYELASTQLIDVNVDRKIQRSKQIDVIKRIVDQETTSVVELSRMDRSIALDQALEQKGTCCKLNSTFSENIFDAPTQCISETSPNARCSGNRNVIVMNDSIERKLNNMFDDVYESEDSNETTSMSTQNIRKILESSQIDRDESTCDTIVKSVSDDQNLSRVTEEPSTKGSSSRQNVPSLIPTQMSDISVRSDKMSVTNDDSRSIEKYSANVDDQSLDLRRENLGPVDGEAVDSVPAYAASSKGKRNPGNWSEIAKSKKSDTGLGSEILNSSDDDNVPSDGNDLDRAKIGRVPSRRNVPSLNSARTSETSSIVGADSPSVEVYLSNYTSKRKRNIWRDSDRQSSASPSGTLGFANEKLPDSDKPVSNDEKSLERTDDFGSKKKIAKAKNINIDPSLKKVRPVKDDKAFSKESDFDPLKLDTEEFLDGLPAVKIAGTISNPASSLVRSESSIDDIGESTERSVGRSTEGCTKRLVRSKGKLSPKREEDEEKKPYCAINAQTPSSSRFSTTSGVTVAKFGSAKEAKEFNDLDDNLEYMDLKVMAERLLSVKSNYSTKNLLPVIDATVELDEVDCKVHSEMEIKKRSTARNLCSVKANNDNSAKDQFTSAINVSRKPESGTKMVRRSNEVDGVNSSALRITKVPSSDANEKSVGRGSRTKGRKIVSQEKRSLNLESEDDSVGPKRQKVANVRVRRGEKDTSILARITVEKDFIEGTVGSQGNNSKRILRGSKVISSPSEEKDGAKSTTETTAKTNTLKRPSRGRPRQSPKDSDSESLTVDDRNTNKEIVRNAINSNSEPGLESQEVEQILFNVVNRKNGDEGARRIGVKCRKGNMRSGKKSWSRGSSVDSNELNGDVPVETRAKRSRRIEMAMVPAVNMKLVVERPKENKVSGRLRSDSQCGKKDVHIIGNSPTNDGNERKSDRGSSLMTRTRKSETLRPRRAAAAAAAAAREQKKPAEKEETDKIDRNANSSTDSVVHLTPIVSTPTRTRRGLSLSVSSFSSPSRTKPRILFTGVKEDEFKDVLLRLGGSVTDKPANCTVLVTDKVRRTFKFLCAVALAVPVVSVDWLTESGRKGQFLNTESYILNDPTEEAKFGFKLRESLERARERKMLAGYTILLTPNVAPPSIVEIKSMIQACGGKTILRSPTTWHENTVIISREEDAANARKFIAKAPKTAVPLLTTEFILTGILRQELDFVTHKLTLE